MRDTQWHEKLRKSGFVSILDLALNVPEKYLDTRLSSSLQEGETATFSATCRSVGEKGGRLLVQMETSVPPYRIEAVIFHPKAYHKALFKPGLTHYLHGKIDRFNGHLQIVNPQKLSQVGDILPRYRSKLRQDVHRRLVAALVTKANLVGEGLDEGRADLIVRAHRPDGRWLALYRKFGGLGPRTVEALKYAEAWDHLRRMGGKRKRFEAMKQLVGDIGPFVENLPFALTAGQRAAIEAIRKDLRSDVAARRMVVGDVGSGKTMVILAAAVMAYPYRSILMAPTSILARQLYEEACTHLPDFVKTALVTQTKEEGAIDRAHLIVGTHALLYRELPDAPLVMVDEQHRFGTDQRKRLERLVAHGEKRPHFLQFSATPIPRTQAMIDAALVDVTLIEGTPFAKEITTRIVSKADFPRLLEHIEQETRENRQVLVVYPLVEESEHIGYRSLEESENFWKERFDGVYVTHGKDRRKDDVLGEFSKKGKILLTTTVIEVGISLPKLSTIVIVGAERMGLATLHQLRGRVGRTGLKGYCFLFTHDPTSERLKAFCQTTDGFEIARLDLKFRKSGDLLTGKLQSGKEFIWLDMAEDEKIVSEVKEALSAKDSRTGGTLRPADQ